MAMSIAMRIVTRIFVFATEVTQGPLLSVHYTHINRTPNSRCVFRLEDTTTMTAHSRATAIFDLAGDRLQALHLHPPPAPEPACNIARLGTSGLCGLCEFAA